MFRQKSPTFVYIKRVLFLCVQVYIPYIENCMAFVCADVYREIWSMSDMFREREGWREREREKERERGRETGREGERERDITTTLCYICVCRCGQGNMVHEQQREKEREREREGDRKGGRERERYYNHIVLHLCVQVCTGKYDP